MKKLFKIGAVVLALSMTLLLSSCEALDEMRSQQAFWMDEEHTGILYDDKLYLLLPECSDLNETYIGAELIYVTEEDVPVLLSSSYGERFYKNGSETMLFMGSVYYCREDMHQGMVDKIASYTLDHYCVDNYDYKYGYDLLNHGLTSLVNEVLAGEEITNYTGTLSHIESIYPCDETMQFIGDSIMFCYYEGEHYLKKDRALYKIPEEYTDIFLNLSAMNAGASSSV